MLNILITLRRYSHLFKKIRLSFLAPADRHTLLLRDRKDLMRSPPCRLCKKGVRIMVSWVAILQDLCSI